MFYCFKTNSKIDKKINWKYYHGDGAQLQDQCTDED